MRIDLHVLGFSPIYHHGVRSERAPIGLSAVQGESQSRGDLHILDPERGDAIEIARGDRIVLLGPGGSDVRRIIGSRGSSACQDTEGGNDKEL
jgi:hypothetical protein